MRKDQSLYLAERVRSSIAEDPDVCELGIEVAVEGERIVLRGSLTSERRKAQVLALAQRLCPGLQVDDEMRVEVLREPKTETV